MKIIGKPYSGKPNVRFDEGELEIEPFGYYASSLLYWSQSRPSRDEVKDIFYPVAFSFALC